MTDLKLRYGRLWGIYYGHCDRTRTDEKMALVGYVVTFVGGSLLGWHLLCLLTSAAGCGTSLLGVPVLGVARVAWSKRAR